MRHIHLDPIGGVAGDMFAAALLDAEPDHAAACLAAASAVAGVPCHLLRHRDAVLAGARFDVDVHDHHHDHDDHPHDHDHHHHTAWADIRARLQLAELPPDARRHALGIFAVLADAEARVHGIAPDAVTFHEVGAADSVADIVAAGWLIAAQGGQDGDATWSCAPVPLGGGRVRTAHGSLPVPAPATALLLEGFETFSDGIGGERVTPTGAAILRYLNASAPPPNGVRRVRHSGIGFGTRAMPGLSNVLRVLISEADAAPSGDARIAHAHRELALIAFEVDDQTAEDLAAGLERLRGLAGVHDALQMPVFGKKGRIATHIQVLAAPDRQEDVIEACFRETTTIGLRVQLVQGRALHRELAETVVDGRSVRVKRVQRPGGATGKVEADDLSALPDQAARDRVRRAAQGSVDD